MFTATYPDSLSRRKMVKVFLCDSWTCRTLTGGADLLDIQEQAVDCLAEALARRIVRGDPIPDPSWIKRDQHPVRGPLYLAPKLARFTLLCGRADFEIRIDAA